MGKIIESFKPGWINAKDMLNVSENFLKIINFYVFSTPCEHTSSRGLTMQEMGWPKDIWQKPVLRKYLLDVAKLEVHKTYGIAKSTEAMKLCATQVGLNGNFQINRIENRIVCYRKNGYCEFLNIFFYIRCALAHGRFRIYADNSLDPVYVMEAIKTAGGYKGKYEVRARMILKESTLLKWAETIEGGEKSLENIQTDLMNKVQEKIIMLLENQKYSSKNMIAEALETDNKFVMQQIEILKKNKRISYDKHSKQWKVISN